MNALQFREQVAGRVPAWQSWLSRLDDLVSTTPDAEILLRPMEDLKPFEVVMMVQVLGWKNEMLVVFVVVGGPDFFNRTFHVNPRFLRFFRPYVVKPHDVLRSLPL